MKQKTILTLGTLFLISASSLFAQEKPENQENNETTQIIVIEETNEVIIKLPRVPDVPMVEAVVPKVITVNSDGNPISELSIDDIFPTKKAHVFSNHIAPPRFQPKEVVKAADVKVGDIKNGRVSAYLHASLVSVDEAKAALKKAGFKVLSTYKVDKKGAINSIVFTNKELTKASSKKTRGFISTLRVTIDTKNKVTVIANPTYMMGAFMQKEYDAKLASATLEKIRSAFPDIKNSSEVVKFSVLKRYHFMENMPYYQDMKVVKKGKTKTLLKKAKKSKKVVYQQKLANGSYILGVKLGKRTSKFVKKIGYQNSGLLPYPVLIENGEAKILAPQYYIAVMYPMLKMSQFMKIATVPGAIRKDIDKIFR